jgi:hypothetical protein
MTTLKEVDMKTRTLLSTVVLALVALALTVPAVGQSITWKIVLHGTNIRNSGTAEYVTAQFTKFNVESVTPSMADGTKLDVFLGPSTNPNEPYGKLVGIIDVDGGLGAMVLIGPKVPLVKKGTTVSVVEHVTDSEAGRESLVLKGIF